MRVLCGVDGSPRSIAAVGFLGRMLSSHHDQVVLYFGRPQVSFRALNRAQSETQTRAIEAYALNSFESALQQLPDAMRERALTISGDGKPARAIIDRALADKCQLITVAAQNASSRLTFFVGGVARSVANQSDIPVLLYRERRSRPDRGPMHVLIAADGNSSVDSITLALQQLHWPEGSVGRIMHVMEYAEAERLGEWMKDSTASSSHAWSQALSEEVDQDRTESRAKLSALAKDLPPIFHGHDPIVTQGHVVEQVLQTIDTECTDLLVVGARKLGALARMLGSTTEGLIQRAPCSILVVHPQPAGLS